MIEYRTAFLAWWGLLLFCLKLGSRRQLDFELRDLETHVLANVNLLAGTAQTSLPVNKTLSHFLGHVGPAALAGLRTQCVRQLIRNRVLDGGRLLTHFVVAVDGTGFLSFKERHCPHCLVHQHEHATYYLHPVLEAKLVDPRGLALSMATEFIENPVAQTVVPGSYEKIKQDCELNAFTRLAAQLKSDFPQTQLCLTGDALYACGPVLSVCENNHWAYVLTFKVGRTPALWAEFQSLLEITPGNRLRRTLPDGTTQLYRWVNDLSHTDDQGRTHVVHALLCRETKPEEKEQTFAWLTSWHLKADNVALIATDGGRLRSKIENEGFNIQKNSGLNLEHAYSHDWSIAQAFYYLLQIAHLFLQMFEKGSLLQAVARRYEQASAMGLFGSSKSLAKRLLESLRYFAWSGAELETFLAMRCQIRLSDSS